MCDVTKRNFEEKYPKIINDLHSTSFISIDCEFSGLFLEDYKCSLFDTPKERYNKLQKSLESFMIIQLGLTTFQYDRMKNAFNSSTYTFYLMPPSLIKPHLKITCQLTSIEFLCKHEFDFNKLFHQGINYLNKSEEKEALRMVQEGSLVERVGEEEEAQKYCLKIREWSGSAAEGSEMIFNVENENPAFVYILHLKIRKFFSNIWTYDKEGMIIIKKISTSEKKELLSDREEEIRINKKLLDSLLGFLRIMKEIEHLKKPIVGHNLLIDLMMIYKQFYSSSPASYKHFKQNIHRIFPHVFDTKTMSFNLRQMVPRGSTWTSNALPDLYHYLRYGKGATLVVFTPAIHHEVEEYMTQQHFHDAGFDSFSTGFCFVKMAHIYSLWDAEKKVFIFTSMAITCSWLLSAVAPMKNHLNVTRGQVNYILLDGPDPKSTRPGLLHIQSKTGQPLDISKISETIAKYASVDIQPLNRYRALMAVSNQRQAREILEAFRNHKQCVVTRYMFLKHSNVGRTFVTVAIIAPIIAFLLLSSKTSKTVK